MDQPLDSSRLRVLMISTDASALRAGSPTRAQLGEYAARLGALEVLVAGAKDARGARVQEGKLAAEGVPGARLLRVRAVAKAVRAKLDAGAFDVVTAQDPFETGLGALRGIRSSRAPETPLHLQVHTDFLSPWYARGSWKNKLRARIADKILPQAAGIRVVSERVKQSLIAR